MDNTKFPLRRANGSPELRTPDDLLGEAAGDLEQLPGKGKPLNLDTYFKVDAEHRVANQLLSDNGLIPTNFGRGGRSRSSDRRPLSSVSGRWDIWSRSASNSK